MMTFYLIKLSCTKMFEVYKQSTDKNLHCEYLTSKTLKQLHLHLCKPRVKDPF